MSSRTSPPKNGVLVNGGGVHIRVFGIDIETCPACGGAVRVIACIEDPVVVEKILTHLDAKGAEPEAFRRPPCRAPPEPELFE